MIVHGAKMHDVSTRDRLADQTAPASKCASPSAMPQPQCEAVLAHRDQPRLASTSATPLAVVLMAADTGLIRQDTSSR